MARDKLYIDGQQYSVAPNSNLDEVNTVIDAKGTCQKSSPDKEIFLGTHSPLSNLFMTDFKINNVQYNCAEQFIQSEKVMMFNDDATAAKIMTATNPYRMKNLGDKVKKFNSDRWRYYCKDIASTAVYAKFSQNATLKTLLLNTGEKTLAESSKDDFWGTGIHLHDRNALNDHFWTNKEGGAMSEILHKVRHNLKAK